MNSTKALLGKLAPVFILVLWGLTGVSAQAQTDITTLHSNTFFRAAGPRPKYAGSQRCLECHRPIHKLEMDTRHAQAFQTLKQIHQDTNPSCVPCHTVGQGLPSGFVSEKATPQLAGVQCESCHGPAANHAANYLDPRSKPLVDKLGTMCGGCHTDSHHPTHDEWSGSAHATVVEDMNPTSRINSCGRCHSGSARLSLIKKKPLPKGKANVGIGCPTCHDPHANHVWTDALSGVRYTNQLRQAITSTNDYFLSTSDVFAKKYNANVNLCAQCHNHRGASWKSSSRPPHHSPQYNMLLGTVGELQPGQSHYQPAHARLAQQCVTCHMQTSPAQGQTVPANTGHGFKVASYNACTQCHPYPDLLAQFAKMSVTDQINQLKGWLDLWAQTKAPAALWTKYGTRAWEYTTPGSLSSGGAGPDSNEQTLIPDNIKKARFNLYLVLHDGSYGAHNGPYTITLLDAAQSWIETELNK